MVDIFTAGSNDGRLVAETLLVSRARTRPRRGIARDLFQQINDDSGLSYSVNGSGTAGLCSLPIIAE